MTRTQRRALPAGRVTPTQALIFGIVTGALSFVVLAIWVNLLSAVLALSAILFYVFVYTAWLKRSSPQNIVIGGAAGAVPVLVGWAAATGHLNLAAWWMFIIVFLWTPPHFWALALLIKKDYARAHVPMLPVVMGEDETKRQIVLYSLLLLGATLILFAIRAMGWFYLASAVALSSGMIYLAVRLLRERGTLASARTLFWYSNLYLALLFAAMVVDRLVV
jgi:protoheme IX farnesyltransferase